MATRLDPRDSDRGDLMLYLFSTYDVNSAAETQLKGPTTKVIFTEFLYMMGSAISDMLRPLDLYAARPQQVGSSISEESARKGITLVVSLLLRSWKNIHFSTLANCILSSCPCSEEVSIYIFAGVLDHSE